ncbi:MFS transporter [Defluviimonas sp. WL0024]|uniref:MFS transporter n=1 Tax=Albidovulum salinarum TaxID=2984153 RepID=A0ABT2X817_9RHOB|nr:MFS transporter [Defluviimonas sp. WL0024]MCU9850086.1 MFS transporter [Defluviimonas sp. WL0024]
MSARKALPEPGLLRARLIAILTAIMVAVVAMFGMATLAAFDRAIAPELENRTRIIGSILSSEIQRTLDLGVPFRALGGLEAYIGETINEFDEISRITIVQGGDNVIAEITRDEAPTLLQRSGLADVAGIRSVQFAFPVLIGNELVGRIEVVGSPQFVETRLRDVFMDVSVLAVVALLLGVELALVVAAASVWKPYGRVLRLLAGQMAGDFSQTIRATGVSGVRRAAVRLNEQAEDLARRAQALPPALRQSLGDGAAGVASAMRLQRMRYSDFNDVRLALFLFATATEITASFLPIYARDAARPAWLSGELSAAAPLGVYLIAVAALSPFGGALSRRFGARRAFVASAVPTAVALASMAIADSLVAVTLWRGVIGIFYALATIACQEYTIRAGSTREASQSSSAFVGMIFGGAFCGSVLGGVIGGRFGFPAALFLGALMALTAGGVAYSAMRGRAGEPAAPQSPVPQPDAPAARGNGLAFWSLTLCVSIPTSATTAIFIWYLAPLGLAARGYPPADVARIIMLYYLASTLIGPLANGLAKGRGGTAVPVVTGAAFAGVILLYFRSASDIWAVLALVSGCGIGHALIRAPMTALAVELAGKSRRMISALRFSERAGALAGLSASALLLGGSDPSSTLGLLGGVSLAGGLGFAIVLGLSRDRDRGAPV